MANSHRKLPALSQQVISRFKAKVSQGKPGECWPWTGYISRRSGYGVVAINQLFWRVHRIAYFIHYGEDPGNLLTCHKCDVRHCCNPHHLFLGTTEENTRDMKMKGRAASGDQSPARIHIETRPRGSSHYLTTLTEDQVIAIRARYAQGGITNRELAKLYGSTAHTIREINSRRTWNHI